MSTTNKPDMNPVLLLRLAQDRNVAYENALIQIASLSGKGNRYIDDYGTIAREVLNKWRFS